MECNKDFLVAQFTISSPRLTRSSRVMRSPSVTKVLLGILGHSLDVPPHIAFLDSGILINLHLLWVVVWNHTIHGTGIFTYIWLMYLWQISGWIFHTWDILDPIWRQFFPNGFKPATRSQIWWFYQFSMLAIFSNFRTFQHRTWKW